MFPLSELPDWNPPSHFVSCPQSPFGFLAHISKEKTHLHLSSKDASTDDLGAVGLQTSQVVSHILSRVWDNRRVTRCYLPQINKVPELDDDVRALVEHRAILAAACTYRRAGCLVAWDHQSVRKRYRLQLMSWTDWRRKPETWTAAGRIRRF